MPMNMKAPKLNKTPKTLVQVSARAFISPLDERGGNPVTIFHLSAPTSADERSQLARSCSWESIIIDDNYSSEDAYREIMPIFHFYMPSGEEVSFCGHAAIGACSFLANKYYSPGESAATNVSFLTAGDRTRYDALVTRNVVKLIMHQQHTEKECSNTKSFTLGDILSQLGLDISDVPSEREHDWPIFLNSSVARPKTLIPISSIQRLHAATPPQNPDTFRDMCDSIESTGVYLYSILPPALIETTNKKVNIEFECRQFPRWSGYPEDPATGIAAGALAASFCRRQVTNCYTCFQGTAMGRPSKIHVEIDDYDSSDEGYPTNLKVTYTGVVIFDSMPV